MCGRIEAWIRRNVGWDADVRACSPARRSRSARQRAGARTLDRRQCVEQLVRASSIHERCPSGSGGGGRMRPRSQLAGDRRRAGAPSARPTGSPASRAGPQHRCRRESVRTARSADPACARGSYGVLHKLTMWPQSRTTFRLASECGAGRRRAGTTASRSTPSSTAGFSPTSHSPTATAPSASRCSTRASATPSTSTARPRAVPFGCSPWVLRPASR